MEWKSLHNMEARLYHRSPCKINVILNMQMWRDFPHGGVCVSVHTTWPPCSGFLSISRMHSGSGKGHGWKQGYSWLLPYSWRKLVNVSKSCSGRNDHAAVCILVLFYWGICLWVWSCLSRVIRRSRISKRENKIDQNLVAQIFHYWNISQHKQMKYFMPLWNILEILATSLITKKKSGEGTKLQVWQ